MYELIDLNSDFPFDCFILEKGKMIYPHWHKEVEIVFVLSGTLILGVEGETKKLSQGDIHVINGGNVHYYVQNSDNETCIFHFDIRIFQDTFLRTSNEESIFHLFNKMKKYSQGWPKESTLTIANCLNDIYKEWTEKSIAYLYVVKARLQEILSVFYRQIDFEEGKKSHIANIDNKQMLDRINKIFEFIDENFDKQITVKDIADYIGYTPTYFSAFIKKNLGFTFSEFLAGYRVNSAKWLLSQGDMNISEVAEKSGFTSSKTFHHVFKKYTGKAPNQYRKDINK